MNKIGLLLESPDYSLLQTLAQKAVDKGVSDKVGELGPLTLEAGNVDIHDGQCHLVRLSDIMGQPFENRNVLKPEFQGEMSRIHQNYAHAMAKHFPNSVQPYHSLEHTALNRRYAFTDGKSFIFMHDYGTGRHGNGPTGYWLVTHISPDSDMGLYKLLSELFRYDNIIMAVTEHMWPQLVRMGLVYPEMTAMVPFSGGMSEKMVFTSDKELMKTQLIKQIVDAYKKGDDTVMFALFGLLGQKDLYQTVHQVSENIRTKTAKTSINEVKRAFYTILDAISQ